MPSSFIQQMKLNFPFLKLKFPFLNCRNASLCLEHCGSHSLAKIPGLGQHPPKTLQTYSTRQEDQHSSPSNFSVICGPKGEDRGKHPTLGCSKLSPCASQAPACWAGLTPSALWQPCWARQSQGFQGLIPCQGSKAGQGNVSSGELIRQIWACSSSGL